MEYRELTKEEKCQVPGLVSTEQLVIGAVNDLGKVEAACGFMTIIHLDPLWVRPDRRRSMFLLRRLWEEVKRVMKENNVPCVSGSVIPGFPGPPHEEVVVKLMTKLAGGQELEGRFFMMPTE